MVTTSVGTLRSLVTHTNKCGWARIVIAFYKPPPKFWVEVSPQSHILRNYRQKRAKGSKQQPSQVLLSTHGFIIWASISRGCGCQ
jgi:hypothetical protein